MESPATRNPLKTNSITKQPITMKNQTTQELSEKEMQSITGGTFAYDAGFFLRELYISVINGGGIAGAGAVAIDLGMNYRPVN